MKRTRKDGVDSPEELQDWVHTVEASKCRAIHVRHLVAGQENASVVATFEVDDDGHYDAAEIYEKVKGDAEGFGGIQRYQLLAFMTEGSRQPRERFPMQVDGGATGDPLFSEGASQHGQIAQLQRHLEATMGMFIRSNKQTLESLIAANASKDKQIEKLLEERSDVFDLIRSINTGEGERIKLEIAAKRQAKRDDALAESFKLIAPGIINKLLPSGEAKTSAVTEIIKSLDDAQRDAIFSMLRPEQAAAFMTLVEEGIAKEDKKKTTEDGKEEEVQS